MLTFVVCILAVKNFVPTYYVPSYINAYYIKTSVYSSSNFVLLAEILEWIDLLLNLNVRKLSLVAVFYDILIFKWVICRI